MPRRVARRPEDRRAAGTGDSVRSPVITAYSNKPLTAAIRRFIVAGAAPRRRSIRTTTPPPGPGHGLDCHSR